MCGVSQGNSGAEEGRLDYVSPTPKGGRLSKPRVLRDPRGSPMPDAPPQTLSLPRAHSAHLLLHQIFPWRRS